MLEVDDEAGGDAGAIGARARGVETDVVHLWAEGQMGKQADVHAATEAIGKLVEGAAVRDVRAAKKDLRKWVDFGGIAKSQPRAKEIGVGVQRNPSRGGVVTAEIADEAEPALVIIGNGTTDTVLIDPAGTSQAEVGVTERGVKGLGVRGDGENGQRQQQEDELFHTIESFRAVESVPIVAESKITC